MAMRSVFSTHGPSVAVEVAPDFVTAVFVTWGKAGPVLTAHATEPLPRGAVVPSVAAANIIDRAVVTAAVRAALERLPRRTTRVGLVVPDGAAKVSLLPFETVPRRPRDLDELIRWQVRKTAPFRVQDAQLAYTPGLALSKGGREYIVVMMRLEIVAEYEAVCVAAGAHPGLVDLASFNLINATLGETEPAVSDDWLLVHEASGYHTLAIVRGRDLVFFRNRADSGEDEDALADLVHQSVMYYEDRLHGEGIRRTVLAARTATDLKKSGRLIPMLERRLDTPVDLVSPRVVALDTDEGGPELLVRLAAPIGLLLRARRVAA